MTTFPTATIQGIDCYGILKEDSCLTVIFENSTGKTYHAELDNYNPRKDEPHKNWKSLVNDFKLEFLVDGLEILEIQTD